MAFKLYLSCYHHEALIASEYEPEEFGVYMAVGPKRQSRGAVMFLEVNPDHVPAQWFDLPRARRDIDAANAEGRRKASKYVGIYRVLEHLELKAFGKLHLVTPDGRVLSLSPQPWPIPREERGENLYLEICPLQPLVASHLDPARFLAFMTSEGTPLRVPRLLVADLRVDRSPSGGMAPFLPYRNPQHLAECLNRLRDPARVKASKTVDRIPSVDAVYRTIRRGFFLGDSSGVLHYPFPSIAELERDHLRWWRSAEG